MGGIGEVWRDVCGFGIWSRSSRNGPRYGYLDSKNIRTIGRERATIASPSVLVRPQDPRPAV